MTKAIRECEKAAAAPDGARNLHEANREAYRPLRYGGWSSPGPRKTRPPST